MAEHTTQTIHFLGKNDTLSTGAEFHSTEFNQQDCVKRALKRLGLCWLASAASLFIILAHWVLVPGFFIAGPILAIQAYRTRKIATHASGSCPVCQQTIRINLEPNEKVPLWRPCPDCKNTVHIAP